MLVFEILFADGRLAQSFPYLRLHCLLFQFLFGDFVLQLIFQLLRPLNIPTNPLQLHHNFLIQMLCVVARKQLDIGEHQRRQNIRIVIRSLQPLQLVSLFHQRLFQGTGIILHQLRQLRKPLVQLLDIRSYRLNLLTHVFPLERGQSMYRRASFPPQADELYL